MFPANFLRGSPFPLRIYPSLGAGQSADKDGSDDAGNPSAAGEEDDEQEGPTPLVQNRQRRDEDAEE